MGGTVSVTVRKDKREFRMQRWTNSLPWFAVNDKLYEGLEEHLQDYLEQWLAMKSDFEKNYATGSFEYNMTNVYFPTVGLCPDGYGLVVVDYDTKTILSMQDYCHFNEMYSSGIALDKMNNNNNDESRYIIFKRLFEKGYIKKASSFNGDVDLTGLSFESIDDKYLTDPSLGLNFIIESDWKIIYFDDDACGVRNFKEKVIELGFELSDIENKYWEESIKEAEEEY